jgi:hypothetical protein
LQAAKCSKVELSGFDIEFRMLRGVGVSDRGTKSSNPVPSSSQSVSAGEP